MSVLQEQEHLSLPDVAAYIVVYSMNERASFQHAVEILQDIRRRDDQGAAVIVVANKSDLVRKRKVNAEGEFPRGARHAGSFSEYIVNSTSALSLSVVSALVVVINNACFTSEGRKRPRY